MKKEEIPAAKTTLKWGWPYIFTIAVLLWFLGYEQQEALAPYYATVALLIASLIPKDARPNRRTLLNMLANSGKIIAEICILLFAIGVIFGALSIVGLATTISFELANLAGGNIWLLPLLTAVAGYILGMGLPASASYILLAVALAPAMIKVGFGVVPTHLFCLYCGMLSFIIPPVALGAIAGAKVAGEKNVMKVGFTAMRLGSGLFIMPFYFIFVPGLLLGQASFGTTMIDFVITGIGLFVAASALERYFINFSLSKVESVLIIAGGLLIAYPDIWTTLSGACLAGIPLIMAFIRKRKIALPSAS
jgi:TRAP-type uncharacterized transport system fused permease subunit